MLTSLLALLLAADPAPASVVVQPATLEIRHQRHAHALQVLGTTADGYSIDLRDGATITSADPKIAGINGGWVYPFASGKTTLTVSVGGKTFTLPVTVQLPASEPPISFRHEIMAVLTRTGCNQGGCHGYSLGKNGFKLSLRGEDPEPDFLAITRDSAGRRITPLAADVSQLLLKARGDIPHEGGNRFRKDSLEDRLLTTWIAQGTPNDLKDPASVVSVRMIPDKVVLKPGQKHRVQLLATYNDGTVRDATRLSIFAANNTQFANVDDQGMVTGGDHGETVIVGRFERTFAATGVVVLDSSGTFTPTPVPADHLIDRAIVEKLNRMRLTPSPVAGDEEFLRRVYLDTIGVQPKPDEIKAFVADTDAKKRERVIDGLFVRPEFVDHWSLKWGDLLQNSRTTASPQSVYLFREFIRSSIAQNLPADEFARKLLTARGGSVDDPASVYFAPSKDANDTVERATQVFCGIRLLCARCHTHPMENWTQADYYGLASFFTQVGSRQDPRFAAVPNSKYVTLNRTAGFANHPRTSRPQPPRFLGGDTPTLTEGQDRREVYAAWLTSPKNPFFARGLVNRIWSYYFHRGIIDPVDDIRSTNPPINPALLDALTADFIANKYDLRHLMRRIVTSATYQRTSVPNALNKNDEQNFSHAIPRRIPAEALLDSLVQASAITEPFPGVPGNFRAAQLPDGTVESPFLKLFGKPGRMDACECERDNGSNMLQALHFLNGKSILGRVQNANARPALLVRGKLSDEELVKDLYLWSLARSPNAKELAVGLEHLKAYGDKRTEAAQDLMWALLNSKDFLLVH